jgi:hypothetical protein
MPGLDTGLTPLKDLAAAIGSATTFGPLPFVPALATGFGGPADSAATGASGLAFLPV